MTETPLNARPQYVSDNVVTLLGFLLGLPVMAAASLLGGFFLAQSFHRHTYFLVWYSMFIAILLSVAVIQWTRFAKCRNGRVSGCLGGASGIVAYLAYYYFSACFAANLQLVNPQVLPAYIEWRLETDISKKHDERIPDHRLKPSYGQNVLNFWLELSILVAFPLHAGWNRSRRAYSVARSEWLQTETVNFPPYSGEALRQALNQGGLDQFLTKFPAGTDKTSSCQFVVEYLLDDGQLTDEPAYISIHDHRVVKPWYWPGFIRINLVRQVEATHAEILSLAPCCKKLGAAIERSHSSVI